MPRLYFLGIAGPVRGKAFVATIAEEGQVLFGRGPSHEGDGLPADSFLVNDVQLPVSDRSAGRSQASVALRDGRYWLRHDDTKNFTVVNNRRLLPGTAAVPVRSGCEITAGRSVFRMVVSEFGVSGNLAALERQSPKACAPRRYGSVFAGRERLLAALFSVLLACLLGWLVVLPGIQTLSRDTARPGTVTLAPPRSRESAAMPLVGTPLGYNYSPALTWLPSRNECAIIYVGPDGRLAALSGRSLEPLWTAAGEPVAEHQGPAVGDLTRSGADAVAYSTRGGTVAAVNPRTGVRLWESSFLEARLLSPSIGDLDGDGANDVVVLSAGGTVFVGRYKAGQVQFDRVQRMSGTYSAPPAIAQLDGDKGLEIVVVNTDGWCGVIDGATGQIEARDYFPRADLIRTVGLGPTQDFVQILVPPSCPATGPHRIVFVSKDPNAPAAFSLRYDAGTVSFEWGQNLYRLARKPELLAPPRYAAALAIEDISSDTQPDFLLATQSGPVVAVNSATGDTLWVSHDPEGWDMPCATPALFDFDKDGVSDVIFGDNQGSLQILSGRDGSRLNACSALGRGGIAVSPLVGDIDGNYLADIAVQDSTGTISVLSTGTVVPDRAAFWPMAGGTPGRTNAPRAPAYSRRGLVGRLIGVVVFAGVLLLANLGLLAWYLGQVRSLRAALKEDLWSKDKDR